MAGTKIDLSGHNAIVTGGAAGMGLAMAQRLARSGANVCIWDLDRDAIDRAVAELSANAGDVPIQNSAINKARRVFILFSGLWR